MRTFAAVLGVTGACAAFACARSGLELGTLEGREPNGHGESDSGVPPDAGHDAGAPSGSLEALCGEAVDAMCRFYTQCFHETFRDHEQCTRELECFGVENLKDAVAKGRVTYDASRARECFETLRSDPCRPTVTGTLLNLAYGVDGLLSACPGVIEPRQQQGEECFATGECVYGHRCIEGAGCPGRCERIPGWHEPCLDRNTCYHPQACLDGLCRLLAREGEPCSSPLDCRGDLDCSPEGRCVMVPRAGLGEPCIRDLNGAKPARLCEDGLFCLLEHNLTGTCKPLAAAGERCVGDDSCLPGHFCTTFAMLPEPVCYPLGDVGALCNQDAWCRPELRCIGALVTSAFATCERPIEFGEPCNSPKGRGPCADGLACDEARCLTAHYAGDACGEPMSTCIRGECVNGICQGLRHVGQACDTFEDCLSRSCEGGRCIDASLCFPR